MRNRLFFLVLALLLPFKASAVDVEWTRKWTEDLLLAKQIVEEVHPDPFTKTSKETFEREIDRLVERLPELDHQEIAVELGRIIALIGDGHTRLTWPLANPNAFVQGHSSTQAPATPDLLFHDYPIRFGIYEEGVFVERVDVRHSRLTGARLVGIGGYDIAEVMRRLEPVIRHDNESQLLDLLPMHMVLAEVLHARGLSPNSDSCAYSFETKEGVVDVELTLSLPDETRWTSVDTPKARPISQKHLEAGRIPQRGAFDRNYWFELLPDSGTVFLQFNGSENDGDETIMQFSERLRRFLEEKPVERIIIDLRYNWGGDNSLNRSLLHALIASRRVHRPGSLFVIIGRGTFSAAMMFAVDLEKHLTPVFVGEPTGSSPVHFGDSRRNKLPNTNLTLRVSTLYWQYSGPRDHRDAIEPQVRVPLRWSDRIAGTDAAIDSILNGPPATLDGPWAGLAGQTGESNFPVKAVLSSNGEFALDDSEATAIRELEVTETSARFLTDSPIGELLVEGRLVGNLFTGTLRRTSRLDYPLPFAMTPSR